MSDIIRLLPDNIANQIAAGEVVQRPASLVKELLENSVDAKSTFIRLIIKNGGKTLVQVIDDGIGMSEVDARMCFERHATSKIKTLDDLYAIHTLGFRGEALASIAAVAQVELKSKRKVDEVGTLVCIEAGDIVKHEACAIPDGTSITVKNLFFNVPARRNFLKSNLVEFRHISDEFIRVSLANPGVGFSLVNEDEEVYHLRAGNLKQRIVGIFGKRYEETLVPVNEKTDVITISGFIGKPEAARKTRGEQFFFANDRYIRNAYLHHAVTSAYDELLAADSFPFYAVFLELDPGKIDINVHPTKTEIKFEDEKMIYAILRTAIKKALSQHHVAPALNFEDEKSIPVPENASQPWGQTLRTGFSTAGFSLGGSHEYTGGTLASKTKAKPEEWDELYRILKTERDTDSKNDSEDEEDDSDSILPETTRPEQKKFLQVHGKYVLSPIRSGLMIVQQQLAHERILYEKYMDAMEQARVYSQQLLFPEVIQLDNADYSLVKEMIGDIRSLGFGMEEFGKSAFLLNAIPIDLQSMDPKSALEKLIDDFKHSETIRKENQTEALAAALARTASIKIGKSLNAEEMTQLVDELFACKMPYFSPDGKPVLITLPASELDKKFRKQ